MQITNISEAKSTLSKLIERVLNGEEVIIGKAGKPIAKIIPFNLNTEPRVLGSGPAGNWENEIWIADDFNESEEVNEMFYNNEDDELFN